MTVAHALKDARRMALVPSISRRRCGCGCGRRATHMGLANGVCMSTGCELYIRRWVKNPQNAWAMSARFKRSVG